MLLGTLATSNAEQRMNKYSEIRWRARETGRWWRLQSLRHYRHLRRVLIRERQVAKVRRSLALPRGDQRN